MLKKVVEQLSANQYEALHLELSTNRGEKFLRLLELCREPGLDDGELRKGTGANNAAFYTLKSRLYDKVQQFLFRTASDNRAELLKNISSIPYLMYHAPRETAISMLEHLESELKLVDMPAELVAVYNALKKLHLHSSNYYHYQQLYNKSVAYALALDKADELASMFTRELGQYLLSHDESKKEILKLYLKELVNVSRLYESHRLRVTLITVGVAYALFADNRNEIPETEDTVEEQLQQLRNVLDSHPDDRRYRFLSVMHHFFVFEYYHRLGLHKNAAAAYEKVNQQVDDLLHLHHSCPSAHFLFSRAERLVQVPAQEYKPLTHFEANPDDTFTYVYCLVAEAAHEFYETKYAEAATLLNRVLNDISFKNFPFAECEVKLFLSLALLLAGKTEQAEITIRSITRKLAGEDLANRFAPAHAFGRFLKTALNDTSSQKRSKVEQAWTTFQRDNIGPDALLKFIRLDDKQLDVLSK